MPSVKYNINPKNKRPEGQNKRKHDRKVEKHLSAYKSLLAEYRNIGTADLAKLQAERSGAEQGRANAMSNLGNQVSLNRRQTKRAIKRKMEKELKILKSLGITITHDHPVDNPVPEPEPDPAPSEADTMAMLLAKIAELEEHGGRTTIKPVPKFYDVKGDRFTDYNTPPNFSRKYTK